jgi:hypothetical protein
VLLATLPLLAALGVGGSCGSSRVRDTRDGQALPAVGRPASSLTPARLTPKEALS